MISGEELKKFSDSFDDEKFAAGITSRISQPWQGWFRNLLTRLCQAFCPTVDAKESVRKLEMVCNGKLDIFAAKLTPDSTRFLGHISAFFDYYNEKQPANQRAKTKRWNAAHPNLQTNSILKLFTHDLTFQERADFLKNFSYAYSQTITPMGELRGVTDATKIYLSLLEWTVFIRATRPPNSVAELHRWMLNREARPNLSPLDELRRQDRDSQELKRLQQICERLELKFGECEKPI